nr:hypothetical protein [Tanacetum cinerariifolium]
AHSRDYCARIMDYCQSREVHTSTLVRQMEALGREVSTLQRQNIEHAQRDVAPEDGDKNGIKRSTRLNQGTTPVTTPSTTTTSVTNAQLQAMINEGVNATLAARDATRNGDDRHTSGTGARRPVQAARECSYSEFLKCKPLDFKGTKGVVELTRWFEKMESVFSLAIAQHLIRLITKESLRTSLGTTRISNHIRDKTQARFILQEMVIRDLTHDLGLYVPSAITIMKVLAYLSAITARGLAI